MHTKKILFAEIAGLLMVVCHCANAAEEPSRKPPGTRPSWTQSYDAGYRDDNGAYAGGSEIMHLTAHKGKLYAANGYWMDARWGIPPEAEKQSAQVLRLDSANGTWQVNLDLGRSNQYGLRYMKGNILKSVTFTRDANGKLLSKPQNLLLMAAGANFEGGGAVSAWVRDDETDNWNHTLVRHGSSAGGDKVAKLANTFAAAEGRHDFTAFQDSSPESLPGTYRLPAQLDATGGGALFICEVDFGSSRLAPSNHA